jgi:hypothetical protein
MFSVEQMLARAPKDAVASDTRTRWEKHEEQARAYVKRDISFHPAHLCPKYRRLLEEFGFTKASQSFRLEADSLVSTDSITFDPKAFNAADIKNGTMKYCEMLVHVSHEHAEDRRKFFEVAWEKEGYTQDELADYVVKFMRKRIKEPNWTALAYTDAESMQEFLLVPKMHKMLAALGGKTPRAYLGDGGDAGGGGGRGDRRDPKKPKIAANPSPKGKNFCSAYLVPRIECDYSPCAMEHPRCLTCGADHPASACTSFDVAKARAADAKRRTANGVAIRKPTFWNNPVTVRLRNKRK